MELFNSREIATFIWIAIGLCIFIFIKSIRRSFKEVLKSFFVKDIFIIYLIACIYIMLLTTLLYYIDFWDYSLLKSTVFWFLSVGCVTLFRINKALENKNYFKEAVKDNVKFSIIFEFIIGLYTFSLWFEIIFVPAALFIGALLAFLKNKKEYSRFSSITQNIVLVLGSYLSIYSIFQVIINYNKHLRIDTLKEFIIAPILGIAFIPFIFLLAIYMNYEKVFASIKNKFNSQELNCYAKKQAILKFNFNINGLKRWQHMLHLQEIKTKYEIINIINQIKHLQTIEKNPPKIHIDNGWSPYLAKEFLAKDGITTGYYFNNYEDEWFACSPYKKLDSEIISNTISYYINGNQNSAKSLKLVLNVNSPNKAHEAHTELLKYASSLCNKALLNSLPNEIKDAILIGREKEIKELIANIHVNKNEWKSKVDGYNINFEIKHKSIL